MKTMKKLIFILAIVFASSNMYSQDESEDLAIAAANPIVDLISAPIQNNLNMNYGTFNRNLNVLNIQPVIPFAGGKLITRTITPIINRPNYGNESGKLTSGLSNIVFTPLYVPESKGVISGFRPVLELPTGGSMNGSEKWSASPSALVLAEPGDWTFGATLNNTWSFAGDSNREDVNHMLPHLFAFQQLGDEWYVNRAPIFTSDWTAKSDDRWIVPLGGAGGKLQMLGANLPVNLQTQSYYNVVRPDFGLEWQWRMQAKFTLPSSLFKGKKKSS